MQQIFYKIRHKKTGRFLTRELQDYGILILFDDYPVVSYGNFFSSHQDAILEIKRVLRLIEKYSAIDYREHDIRVSRQDILACEVVEFTCSEISASSVLFDLESLI